ncbi:MAG: protoporphyrinogen oxidase [Candidatus Binataceae bacterium]
MNRPFRIAVIGGGISGLAAAHRLREIGAAREIPLDVTVYERGTALGGALRTVRHDGFVMEAGADSFLTEKPWARALAERIGLGEALIPTREEFRKTYVVRGGRLAEIPAGFSLLAPASLGPVFRSSLFSPWAKLRIAFEPLIPRRRDVRDESLASFVTRRLGREVLDRLAQPLASGIYTADPTRLSMQATMPRFVEMERRYGSVVRGLRAAEQSGEAMKNTSGARWSLFLSLRAGVGSLVEALAARLEGSILRGTEVTSLARDGHDWRIGLTDGKIETANAIVCAAPAYAAARMLAGVDEPLSAKLTAIAYSSAAVVNMAFRESDFPSPPRSFGFVVPAIECRRIIAGSFTSLKFEARAPEGFVVARAFLGGVLQSGMMEKSDDELVGAARDEFAALLGVAAPPQFADVARWPDSMPQYAVGHLDRVAEIEARAHGLGRFELAGAAYRGVGIPDCIRSGEQAAEAVVTELTASAR